jgi:hypothetical protein
MGAGVSMSRSDFTEEIKASLRDFLSQGETPEVVGAYLHFVEQKYGVHPVLFPKEKRIFRSANDVIPFVEKQGKLWHEAEITIGSYEESVNEGTKRLYICPFTGKVFGDNTHPNPQDAIYDWVSNCPENTERVKGLRVKRFYVSEDPEVIRSYIKKQLPQQPIRKTVYSSALSGKLFSSKEGVIEDFKKNHLKRLSLFEVQAQNRYQIEESLLSFIREHLTEDKVAAFVEELSSFEEFSPFIAQWVGE